MSEYSPDAAAADLRQLLSAPARSIAHAFCQAHRQCEGEYGHTPTCTNLAELLGGFGMPACVDLAKRLGIDTAGVRA